MAQVLYTMELRIAETTGDHSTTVLASERIEARVDLPWMTEDGMEVRLPADPCTAHICDVILPGASNELVEIRLTCRDLPCPRNAAGKKSGREIRDYLDGVVAEYAEAGWKKTSN